VKTAGEIEMIRRSCVRHVHVYSMNKPEVVRGIQESLNKII